MNQNKLVIYNDVKEFGGHEVMVLCFLKYILSMKSNDIYFMCSARNAKLLEKITDIKDVNNLSIITLKNSSGRLQFLKSFVAILSIARIISLLLKIKPKCVLVIQGDISLSTVGLIASKLSHRKTISYIPMAHSRYDRGEGLFSKIKDVILRFYYSLPDAFITISKSVKRDLINMGVKNPVSVIYNGIDTKKYNFNIKVFYV